MKNMLAITILSTVISLNAAASATICTWGY